MDYMERFKVAPGSKVKLKKIDPALKDSHESHESAIEEIAHYQEKLCELQDLLYAEHGIRFSSACRLWTREAKTA